MIRINEYINEKLYITKDIEYSNDIANEEGILPTDSNANDLCDKVNKIFKDYFELSSYALIIGDSNRGKHFYLRPKNDLNVDHSLKDKSPSYFLLQYIKEDLGHLYIIAGKYSAIDNSSRINNLKRTYWSFYAGEYGELFNDKKEANKYLKEAKQNGDKLGGHSRTYKVMSIKEINDIKTSSYGDKIENFKFEI